MTIHIASLSPRLKQEEEQQHKFRPVCDLCLLRCFQTETSRWRPFVMLTHGEPRGGGSDDSDSGFGKNVRALP